MNRILTVYKIPGFLLQFGLTWNGSNKEELDLTTSAVFSESPPPAAWLYLSALHELPVWLRTRRLFPLSHFPFSEIGGGGSPLATLCPSCLGLPALWDKVCLTALLNTFKLHRRQFLKLIGPHHQSSGGEKEWIPLHRNKQIVGCFSPCSSIHLQHISARATCPQTRLPEASAALPQPLQSLFLLDSTSSHASPWRPSTDSFHLSQYLLLTK